MSEEQDYPTDFHIQGNKVSLSVPSSYYVRSAIIGAHDDAPLAAFGAALGVSYPKLQRAVPWDHKPIKYGSKVVDYLAAQGWTLAEIKQVGSIAWVHIMRSMPDWKKVTEQADFTEGQEGATSTEQP